jgi:hypothetical protein
MSHEKAPVSHPFDRRTFLRGLGVTMALPWMESLMVWGDEPRGRQQSSEAPVRLAISCERVVGEGIGFRP